MANHRLITYLRAGNTLIIATPYGPVDLRNTATVWGEGPNVDGYCWARSDTPLTQEEGTQFFGEDWHVEQEQAALWAMLQTEREAETPQRPLPLGEGREEDLWRY